VIYLGGFQDQPLQIDALPVAYLIGETAPHTIQNSAKIKLVSIQKRSFFAQGKVNAIHNLAGVAF
jgi:hypothetical protein